LQILDTQSSVAELFARAEQLDAEIVQAEAGRSDLRTRRTAIHTSEDELHAHRRRLSDASHACELQIREARLQLDTLQIRIEEEYQLKLPDLVAEGVSALNQWKGRSENESPESEADDPAAGDAGRSTPAMGSLPTPPDRHLAPAGRPATGRQLTGPEVRGELEIEVQRLRRKLKAMGHVNTDALESLDELESRFARLSGQLQDLTEARSALEDIIRRINAEGRRMFLESFESIRGHFRELFRKLFGGGEADIVLEDPNDVLECGIDIVARPPGKELRSITLLSGGEKTLTAIALLFAMFKSKPSPYCILDEVDAALDEANVERYAAILKDFVQMTQFVVITHRKRTMTAADVIYGVTMEQAGVSKRMSVRFEEVAENGEIRTRGGRAA
jgi:chromosome segregation protein